MMKNTLEYRGYHADVKFDAEDELFIGTITGIEDAVVFRATSLVGLKKRFQDYIDDCLGVR